jgi:hypothetical protein
MVDISKEHAVETFKSLVQISLEGLKLLALFNGGAAVAIAGYTAVSVRPVRWSATWSA